MTGRKEVFNSYLCSSENQSVSKEMVIHGQRWSTIFDGYFSDPEIARPLLDAVERTIDATRAEVVADIGGGTGFILEELQRRGLKDVRLMNVDASPKQLSACNDDRIIALQASADKVTRSELQAEGARLLLIARSILHYFGRLSLDPLLRHLHGLLLPGEFFVHQSGVFQVQRDADLINHLYARMDTQKCFFTVDELKAKLEDAGFIVHEISPAPVLKMSSVDLGERYGLSPELRASIGQEVEQMFGRNQEVFTFYRNGFKACLHSAIFTCEAE